jgi:hypothetical protein
MSDKTLVPPDQGSLDPLAKDIHSPLFNAVIDDLDEANRIFLAEFLAGGPYREV